MLTIPRRSVAVGDEMKESYGRLSASASASIGTIMSVALGLLQACTSQHGKLDPDGTAGGAPASVGTDTGGHSEQPGLLSGGSVASGGSLADSAAGAAGSAAAETGGRATCVFHVDPTLPPNGASAGSSSMADGGVTGATGAADAGTETAPTITVQKHVILGPYLADARGMSLYVYGADTPGDCSHLPVSACLAADACIVAWPVFYASAQRLAAGLDAQQFGQFLRSDGVMQTTYHGWPLYLYKSDVAAGDTKGHARGIWYLAQTALPNVWVRRSGTTRLLSDSDGRTLYAFDQDTRGTTEKTPVSACNDKCRSEHPPFMLRYLEPVSLLTPTDLTIFVRSDGAAQIAFKGAPLYWSSSDLAPGDTLGLLSGWSTVSDQ